MGPGMICPLVDPEVKCKLVRPVRLARCAIDQLPCVAIDLRKERIALNLGVHTCHVKTRGFG